MPRPLPHRQGRDIGAGEQVEPGVGARPHLHAGHTPPPVYHITAAGLCRGSLIESAKLNGLNPQLYLADVLARIADHPARRIAELLPWNWQPLDATRAAA